MLYLVLTNEPSNHKEWAREERREGVRRGKEREKRKRKCKGQKKKWWKKKMQGKNRIIEQGNGIKKRGKRNKI